MYKKWWLSAGYEEQLSELFCAVLYTALCTVISTLIWSVLRGEKAPVGLGLVMCMGRQCSFKTLNNLGETGRCIFSLDILSASKFLVLCNHALQNGIYLRLTSYWFYFCTFLSVMWNLSVILMTVVAVASVMLVVVLCIHRPRRRRQWWWWWRWWRQAIRWCWREFLWR